MTDTVATSSFLATRRGKLILAFLLAVAFLDFLDTSIVNVALPSIARDLHFSVQNLQWVLSGYIVMPSAQPCQLVIRQAAHDGPHHGHPAGAGGQDLGVAGLRGQVDAERGRVRRRIPALRQAERVVGPLLVQHCPAGPGVSDEDQMTQCLGE